MMMMFAAALAAAAPAATAPAQAADAHAQHKAGSTGKAEHKGMDCCKECCKGMAKKHESRDQHGGHGSHSGS